MKWQHSPSEYRMLCILIEKYAVSRHPRQGVEAENNPNDDMKMQTLLRRVQFSMLHRTGVEAKDSPSVSKTCPKMLPKISSNKQKHKQTMSPQLRRS